MVSNGNGPAAGGRFQGRTFFVAGAAGGLGSAIAARLGAEGAKLALADLAPVEAPEASEVVTLPLEALDVRSWQAARSEAEAKLGPLDGVVHTIGTLGREAPVTDLALEEWNQVVAVNLTSAYLALATFLPQLVERERGRVVLLASIAGKEGNANQAAYSAAKGGLIALTKSVAKEVATEGVTVNCIAPTMIEGPLMQRMTQQQIDSLLVKIPMRRVGRPEEVASLAAWLLSDEATFSTGQCFDLSGGRAVY